MALGMNLAGISTFNGALPFANLCTLGVPWVKSGTATYTEDQGELNVTSVTGTATFTMGIATTGWSQHLPAGEYTILTPPGYEICAGSGQGAADYLAYSTGSATRPFTLATEGQSLFITIKVTTPGLYKDIAVILPGHLASYQGGDIFSQDLINYYGTMKSPVLRFMDWTATNRNIDTNWADRTVPGKVTLNKGAGQVPWEHVIALANRLNKDPWINVPTRATQAYVDSLAALFAANLNPGLKPWVETGNELSFNSFSVFAANYAWFDYLYHTRITATVDASTGVVTKNPHGLASGALLVGWATMTSRVANTNESQFGNSYFIARGIPVYVQVLDASTFKVFEDAGFTKPILWPTGTVDWIYSNTAEAGKTPPDQARLVHYANYAAMCVRNWAAFDAAMGAGRVKALLGSQAPGTTITSNLLGQPGVASRVNAVHVAPYFQNVMWWGGQVDISSGKFRPRVWSNSGSGNYPWNLDVHFSVYAAGSTPTKAQRKAGTGTGLLSKTSIIYKYGARQDAPVTISVASPAVVTWDTVAPAAGKTVVLSTTGALPTGLATATTYYVVNPSGNTFQLAATLGGTPINTTGAGSGTHTAVVTYGTTSYVDGQDHAPIDGTPYDFYMDAVDHNGFTWTIKQALTSGGAASTVEFLDTYANQQERCLISMGYNESFKFIEDQIATIAASAVPNTELLCYESGMHVDETAPTAVNDWMWNFVEDPLYGEVLTQYNNGLAARNVKTTMYFGDVGSRSLSWSAADWYGDTTDARFLALSAFQGSVPKRTRLQYADVTGANVRTDPGNFPTPTTVAALQAGLTYKILKGDDEGNYQVSGDVLQMVNDVGVDWGAPTPRSVLVRATDGNLSEIYPVNFATGDAWYESDAKFALDMTTQASAASLAAIYGGALTPASTQGTLSGGMLSLAGASAYSNNNALLSTISLAIPTLIAAVIKKDAFASGTSLIQFGSGPFVSFFVVGGVLKVRFWSSAPSFDLNWTVGDWTDNTKAVFWVLIDQANNLLHFGKNTTLTNPGGTAHTSWPSGALGRFIQMFATGELKGSLQVINRAGMTPADVTGTIVPKMKTLHSIP